MQSGLFVPLGVERGAYEAARFHTLARLVFCSCSFLKVKAHALLDRSGVTHRPKDTVVVLMVCGWVLRELNENLQLHHLHEHLDSSDVLSRSCVICVF